MREGGGASAVELSGELARRLEAVGRAVSPGEIEEVWIFPPLSEVERSAEFVLFTRLVGDGRRRVYSARVPPGADGGQAAHAGNGAQNGAGAARNGGRPAQEITEHGSVPAGRVDGLVSRFRRRLGDAREPLHVVVEGESVRWRRLVSGGPGNGAARAAAARPDGAPNGNGAGPEAPDEA